MNVARVAATLLIVALPIAIVYTVKDSDYGRLLATPKARMSGSATARVTIIEFSDFQCPACAAIQPYLKELTKTYDGKVRLYFKHYPLSHIHPNAMPAAVAAECAADQDRFWPYSDTLYSRQALWARLPDATTHYTAIAGELNLNVENFNACLANPHTRQRIEADIAEAKSRGVNATPTFFVDGERLVGQVFASDGARAVERALRR